MDHSRVRMTTTPLKVPLMPMRMEITSIKDVHTDFDWGQESKREEKEEIDVEDKEERRQGDFYDASNKFPLDEEHMAKKPSRRQQKMLKRLKKTFL